MKVMFDLVVKNGTAVLPNAVIEHGNIGVKDGKIAAITNQKLTGTEVVDATGLHVFAGVVDPHMHIGLFGGTVDQAEEYRHETAYAAQGGCTTLMVYQFRAGSYVETNHQDLVTAEENSVVDFTFRYCISDKIHRIDKTLAETCSF